MSFGNLLKRGALIGLLGLTLLQLAVGFAGLITAIDGQIFSWDASLADMLEVSWILGTVGWGICASTLGLILVARAGNRPELRALAVVLLTLSLGWCVDLAAGPEWLPDGHPLRYLYAIGPHGNTWISQDWVFLALPFIGASVLVFALSFPRPLLAEEVEFGVHAPPRSTKMGGLKVLESLLRGLEARGFRIDPVLGGRDPSPNLDGQILVLYQRVISRPAWVWIATALWTGVGMMIDPQWASGLQAAWLLGTFISLPMALVLAVWHWRIAIRVYEGTDRTKVIWFLNAVIIPAFVFAPAAFLVILARRIAGADDDLALFLAIFVMFTVGAFLSLGIVGYAALARDVLDPRLTVRRTVVFSILGGILLVMFGVVEAAVADLVLESFRIGTGWAPLIAGASVAVVAKPLYHVLETGVGHFIDDKMAASSRRKALAQQGSVVFCDIVGFTALTESDRAAALAGAGLMRGIAQKEAEIASGRLVKTIGDAVLLAFPDPKTAVRASKRILAIHAMDVEELDAGDVQIRIGVATGIFLVNRNGDIFGSIVNMAARLQAVAGPGTIVLDQRSVEDGDLWESTTDLGERHLRGFDESVRCFSLVPGTESPLSR